MKRLDPPDHAFIYRRPGPNPAGRACRSCGAELTTYNSADDCAPCRPTKRWPGQPITREEASNYFAELMESE